MPTIKIDFFQVLHPDEGNGNDLDLADVLKELFKRPPADRILSTTDGWIHLIELDEFPGLLSGVLLKAKTDQIPRVANRSGTLEELLLKTDQGLAGITHFLYKPTNRILLLHRNMQGVRPFMFERYFMELCNLHLELQVVIQDKAMQRLQHFQTVRKISFKIANPHASVAQKYGSGLNEMIKFMDNHHAPEVEITLGMGRKRGSLSLNNVIATAQRLLRIRSSEEKEVVKITALGADDDGSVELDLIKDRIVEAESVPLEGRYLSDSGCAAALRKAYEKHRREISDNYGK